MMLPKRITGFYANEFEKPPMVDEKQFKQICFTVAQSLGEKMLEDRVVCCQGNFIENVIEIEDKKHHILLNRYHPIVAIASNVEYGSIEFIDEPKLAEHLAPYYKVQSCDDLNEPLQLNFGFKRNLLQIDHELNQAELEQIMYWKPRTVGEIIYNQWD